MLCSLFCRWSFHKDEPFGAVVRHYMNNLLTDIPTGTETIHFCCDRYTSLSVKYVEQQHRYARSRPARQFEISEHYTVHDPQQFFSLSPNNAGLLNFLCETLCDEEQLQPTISSTRLYLGGGFKDETKSVLVTAGTVTQVADLESTQQEADTRVILHAIYSVQNEDVERIIINANDTGIVVINMCVLYIRFNVAEKFVGTVGSHRMRHAAIYQSMRLRLHLVRNQPRTAIHPQFEWERSHNLPILHCKEDLD